MTDVNQQPKNFKQFCRVCLSEVKERFFLDNPFYEKNQDGPSILEILQMVMCAEAELHREYPCIICAICLDVLKRAYKLKQKFVRSQKILQRTFSSCTEEKEFVEDDSNDYEFVENTSTIYVTESGEISKDLKEYENSDNIETIYINYTEADNTDIESGEYVNNSDIDTQTNDDIFQIKTSRVSNKSKLKSPNYKLIDFDNYIINSNTGTNPTKNVKNPIMDEDLIQAAFKLQYECPACPKFYTSKTRFEKHKEGCKKLKNLVIIGRKPKSSNEKSTFEKPNYPLLYKCDKCPELYTSTEELESHTEMMHNVNEYAGLNLRSLSEIDQELFKSAMLLRYECNNCPKVYSSEERFKRHKEVCKQFKKKRLVKPQRSRAC